MENNLDYLCARGGQEIVEGGKKQVNKARDVENPIQKSLGVLQEDGIYAFYIYLASEGAFKGNNVENTIKYNTWELLSHSNLNLGLSGDNEKDKDQFFKELQKFLSKDLDEVFLAKELLEKTMTYARYHAKALTDDECGDEK